MAHPLCEYEDVRTYEPREGEEGVHAYALAAADDAAALEVLWQAAIEAYRRGDLSGVVAAIDKASSWEREYGDDPGTSCLRDRLLQEVE